MYNVAFPNLGLYFNIKQIAISIGNINIYWYGILIASAIVLGLIFAKMQNGKYNISYNIVEEFILWALPISIICARLYYVVFSMDLYKSNLIKIFAIWEGGLAIYGGVIGAIATAIIFAKIKKINLFDLLDYCVPFLALGQAIGRWGNFINREAYGAETASFLRMEILQANGGYISVHPTFLYESIGLLTIFLLLQFLPRKFQGEKFSEYFIGYGILRFFVEWLRVDSLMFFSVKVSMVVSALLFILGVVFIVFLSKQKSEQS